MRRTEELALFDVASEAEPQVDWLAAVIRFVLHAGTESIEPSPTTWDRIRQRIEVPVSSPPYVEDV